MYRLFGKRLLDLAASLVALVALSPVILAVAALVRWKLGSPVLFRQARPGLGGRPFAMLKFRTMANLEPGLDVPAERRLSPFGTRLRRASLDELPELVNVLKGDMSLVGPRPLLMKYLPRYTPEQARRHEVLPGVTGWAQVNGRNAISWEKKFELDVWYVDRRSLALDLRILALPVLRLLRPQGISAEGHATMPEFMGSSKESRKNSEDRQ